MFRTLLVLMLGACDVGSVLGGPDASSGGDSGAGGPDAAVGPTPLRITLTTSQTATPQYAPSNIVAVWIENADGALQKTIGRWAETRKQHLVAWSQKAGTNDVDAISGATRLSHTGALTVTWDLKSRAGTTVPDGTYTVRMECTDLNATTAGQNNQGTFTFVKSAQAQSQPGLSGGGFTNVSIEFTP